MSHQIVKTAIVSGSKHYVYHVNIVGDGQSGELKDVVLLDQYRDLDPPMAKTDKMRLSRVWYSSSWFDVELKFNALDKVTPWILVRDGDGFYDFTPFGGLKDWSEFEKFGQLLVSTTGLAQTTGRCTMVIDITR